MRSGAWRERRFALLWGLLIAALVLVGCDGSNGQDGMDGADGQSTAILSGTVTNAMTGGPIAGAVVETDPVVPGMNIVADAAGNYSAELPIGNYDLTCMDSGFTPGTAEVSLVAGVPATRHFGLTPEEEVVINVTGLPGSIKPGDSFQLTATATPFDGSSITGFSWAQSNSVDVELLNDDTQTVTVNLPGQQAYRDELFSDLNEATDTWRPQAINPLSLEEAGHVAIVVTVTTTSGDHTFTVDVHADLSDFVVISTGIRNVPRGLPVLLHGRDQASYNWTFAQRPTGSSAAFNDPAIRNPSFVPDVEGLYVINIFDIAADDTYELEIYAGLWAGAIIGQDVNGRPESDCVLCHNAGGTGPIPAPATFDEWKETGHAEIFSQNLDAGGHYSASCFPCHTVGYDTTVDNNGFDDQDDYQAFLNAGLLGHAGDNWTTVLANFPDTARLANIQCENCHGPQSGPTGERAHMQHDPRVDLSSELCGSCHGEPARHARYQQWEESGHNDYALAYSRGTSGSCSRCHTANGFIKWVPRILDNDPTNDTDSVTIDWPREETHPQTCAACHDPHNIGTTSGDMPNATVRVMNNTGNLEAGFKATAVGKGATCMQCHNSRRGLRNDNVFEDLGDPDRAPHGRPNADILMGQNLFFVNVGTRAAHSLITGTCVTCHMELTDPPPELSYELGGTNHTFEASHEICGNCHGNFTAENVQLATELALADLEEAIIEAIRNEIEYQLALGSPGIEIEGADEADEVDRSATITDISQVGDIHIEDSHGRQAMTIVVNGVDIHHVQLGGDTNILGPDISLVETPNGSVIARAGWNYWIIETDGSKGVHNPSFVLDGLTFARQQLEMLDYSIPE